MEEARAAVRCVAVRQLLLQHKAQVSRPVGAAHAQRNQDSEWHVHRRADLQVLADQTYWLEVAQYALSELEIERARAQRIDGYLDGAPASSPGVARRGSRYTVDLFRSLHIVRQRDGAQLAGLVRLRNAPDDLSWRLGCACVRHVEW